MNEGVTRVLVIGARGRVAALIEPRLAQQYALRMADLRAGEGCEFVDVLDVATLRAVIHDVDVVVYLAMGRESDWGELGGWAESHFDVNVKGLYLTVRVAAEAGVRKIVYASSLSIFDDYLQHGQALEDRDPDATDAYGLSKALGEQVCRAAAAEHGIDVVSLRLCGPMSDEEWRDYAGEHAEIMTAGSDVGSAFAAAIAHQGAGFESFVISGDGDQRYIRQERTFEILGWRPASTR